MKGKRWIAVLLAAVAALLCAAAFGETADKPEKTVYPVTVSEMIDMLYTPKGAPLVGETISITANFGGVVIEGTEDVYCFLVLARPGVCSSESIRFIPDASCAVFPEPNTVVTLTGTLIRTETGGLRIIDATLTWE